MSKVMKLNDIFLSFLDKFEELKSITFTLCDDVSFGIIPSVECEDPDAFIRDKLLDEVKSELISNNISFMAIVYDKEQNELTVYM